MRISTFIVYYYYTNKKIIYDTINNFFNENKENNQIDDLSDSMILLYNVNTKKFLYIFFSFLFCVSAYK